MQINITEKEAIALFNIYHLMEIYTNDDMFCESVENDMELLQGILVKFENEKKKKNLLKIAMKALDEKVPNYSHKEKMEIARKLMKKHQLDEKQKKIENN